MRSPASCARTVPKRWRWPTSATCSRATTRSTPSSRPGSPPSHALVHFDVGGLDHRPPFFYFGLLMGGECFRRLLGARRNFQAYLGQPLAHRRVGQRLDHRSVELGDDVFRRAFWSPNS